MDLIIMFLERNTQPVIPEKPREAENSDHWPWW